MPDSLILKSALFVINEMIEGDYIEFGIYKGRGMINAAHSIKYAFEKRINTKENNQDLLQLKKRQDMLENIKLVGFDSFEGLPKLTQADKYSDDFKEGQYVYSPEKAYKNIIDALNKFNAPTDNVMLVKGWFENTVNKSMFKKLGVAKASIINIDCDLYSSTLTVLNGSLDLIQDGTILIFDDWFCFKGSPNHGQQKAFSQWKESQPGIITTEFHSEGVYKKSFICHRA